MISGISSRSSLVWNRVSSTAVRRGLARGVLKAVALARNRGLTLAGQAGESDFLRMYRPQTNVVTRPTADGPRLR